ncbi:MAG TPA: hypothetical protein PKB06_09975, partial [Actinotalea sp.]|nr:hypothetical protein [Actinotalea sp.]
LARRRARHRLLVAAVVVVGAVVASLVAVNLWLLSSSVPEQPSTERVSQALADAAASQEAYRDLHGRYTADVGALVQAGWVAAPDVEVSLVSAGRDSFCLAAGPAGATPIAWLTEDWAPSPRSCE